MGNKKKSKKKSNTEFFKQPVDSIASEIFELVYDFASLQEDEFQDENNFIIKNRKIEIIEDISSLCQKLPPFKLVGSPLYETVESAHEFVIDAQFVEDSILNNVSLLNAKTAFDTVQKELKEEIPSVKVLDGLLARARKNIEFSTKWQLLNLNASSKLYMQRVIYYLPATNDARLTFDFVNKGIALIIKDITVLKATVHDAWFRAYEKHEQLKLSHQLTLKLPTTESPESHNRRLAQYGEPLQKAKEHEEKAAELMSKIELTKNNLSLISAIMKGKITLLHSGIINTETSENKINEAPKLAPVHVL